MMFLYFRVRNHCSVRDEVTLEFNRPTLRTLTPSESSWVEVVYPLCAVLGANASGKSSLLDALQYFFAAIRSSATNWLVEQNMVRSPFKLDEKMINGTSEYELGFVLNGRRYEYGFEVAAHGIVHEWLRDVPSTRWRTLLERKGTKVDKFNSKLGTRFSPAPRELMLSRAKSLDESFLGKIAHGMCCKFDVVLVKDSHREARLNHIADSLAEGRITHDDIKKLLVAADIGIEDVDVDTRELPEFIREIFEKMMNQSKEDDETDSALVSVKGQSFPLDELRNIVVRSLVFKHRGESFESPSFSIEEESDGTVAWLAVAVPALDALRNGGVLVVDEIDASLHPHLLDMLLSIFADLSINDKCAQLIFTVHDAFILSPLAKTEFDREQIWFTEKDIDGATELTSLADYRIGSDANIAKRYYEGRFGGVPWLVRSGFSALLDQSENGE